MRSDPRFNAPPTPPHCANEPTIAFGHGLVEAVSGGGKIILPGVASYETVQYNHMMGHKSREQHTDNPVLGMGVYDDNPLRRDIDEAASMVGVDFSINCLMNGRGETVAVHAGDLLAAHRAAVQEAKAHYLTPKMTEKDIVIANSYAKANEAITGLLAAFPSVGRGGGDVVLIANAPEGQITHYLMGPFGNEIGGALQLQMALPDNVNRLIIFSEYPELSSKKYLEATERVVLAHDWDEVVRMLRESYGDNAKAGIYPNADIQYG